jgi:hypothetical protein
MLNEKFANRESLVSAVKQHYVVPEVATFNTFNAAFVLLSNEWEEDYINLGIEKLCYYRFLPVVTDRELALMNAINSKTVFSQAANLLCIWYINKNIVASFRPVFIETGHEIMTWTVFMKHWEAVVQSPSLGIFSSNWADFKDKYQPI